MRSPCGLLRFRCSRLKKSTVLFNLMNFLYMSQAEANQTHITASQAGALPVMEAFYTLQGEGYHQGKAAYFIRLGGCDVGCVWCDVKDSWDVGKHPLFNIEY